MHRSVLLACLLALHLRAGCQPVASSDSQADAELSKYCPRPLQGTLTLTGQAQQTRTPDVGWVSRLPPAAVLWHVAVCRRPAQASPAQ